MCETTTTTKTTHFVYLAQSVQQQRKQRQQLITLFSWLISASCSLVLPLLARLAFSVSEHSFSSPLPSTGETLPSTGETLPSTVKTAPLPKRSRSRAFADIIGILDQMNVMFAQRWYLKQYLGPKSFSADVFGRCTAALINPFGQ